MRRLWMLEKQAVCRHWGTFEGRFRGGMAAAGGARFSRSKPGYGTASKRSSGCRQGATRLTCFSCDADHVCRIRRSLSRSWQTYHCRSASMRDEPPVVAADCAAQWCRGLLIRAGTTGSATPVSTIVRPPGRAMIEAGALDKRALSIDGTLKGPVASAM
jgi:hypothetical protein